MKTEIIIFEPHHSHSFEEGAEFVAHESGLIVNVAQECAVDSYNQSFECSLHMSLSQTVQLRDWLNKQFPITAPTPSERN